MPTTLVVNGVSHAIDAGDDRPLLGALRDVARPATNGGADMKRRARQAHPTGGPRTLLAYLARRHPRRTTWPVASTVRALLQCEGRVGSVVPHLAGLRRRS